MRTGTIAFMMGIVVAQQCSEIPNSAWLLLLPGCLFLFGINNPILKVSLAFIAGFLWVFAYLLLFSHSVFPSSLEGKELLVEGTIASIPKQSSRFSRFDFSTSLNNKPYLFRLNWYEKHTTPPQAGEYWRLLIKLKRPRGVLNEGGFDYERNLYRHGISATGYVRRNNVNEKITSKISDFTLNEWVAASRQSISTKLRNRLNGNHNGVIEALAIGVRDEITPVEWDVLTRTGTIHLVAISGLHIGLVAGLVFFIVRFLISRSRILMRYYPAQVYAAACAIVVAFLYAMLAGFSIPTQRALLMICVVMISLMQRRVVCSSYIVALSLLLILIFDPLSVLDKGFWLSFGAVAVILFAAVGRIKSNVSVISWGKIQIIISLGMLPLTLFFFQRISLSAPIANLLAVPLVSFITVPTTLLGTLVIDLHSSLSDFLLYIATESLNILWLFLDWVDSQDWSVIETHNPIMWTLLPMTIGALWLLMPRGFPARWVGIILFLPVFFMTNNELVEGELKIHLIDVGQGLSVFIKTRNHQLLYDTGARHSESFDAGKNIIIPFLKSQNVLSLDALVVSHGDNDHSGGANSILRKLAVNKVYSGARPKRWYHKKTVSCVSGQTWSWDGVYFEFLHPVKIHNIGGNNNSCVLQVSIGSQRILLTGDIEAKAEKALVARFRQGLQSNLLIAPHHGSNTSSSQAFIDSVSPQVVWVANGYRNRYGFPHPNVTQRYRNGAITMFETAKLGGISSKMTAEGFTKPIFSRYKMQRYWHTQ